MNIFTRELKANLKSLLIWGIIMALFVLVGSSKFSAYYGNPEMLKILDGLPPAMLSAFNMQAFNLTTISGFYGVMFSYFALLVAIAAAMWGSDIISKEERDKTVEFSLTLPVTRGRVVTAKTLAALVNCIGLVLITWGASLAAVAKYPAESGFQRFLALCMLALFIMEVLFLAVGIFLGCAMKRYRRAGSVAVSLLLVTFFLSVMTDMNKDLGFLKYVTPFKYFDAAAILHQSRIDPMYVGLSLAVILVCMVGAYLTYARRDLYI
jgi:ABC-2 type transport system permease protein